MSQVITDAFSSYWQQCLIDQTPVVLDEFVLAHIPGLDPDAPISPASGLPPVEQVVHRHVVDQRGRINNDAVAYSIVMDTTVGDFTFNAMYLINSALNLVGMIVHKGEETKLRTDPAIGQTGNSLVKSMLMEYDRAAEASQTVIDASTWQIDYAARLRGMDEDLRHQAMGTFGHAAFYGDGFKLVSDAGLYKVQPGQGYVGGLLVELAGEQEVIPGAKPVGLWLDVYRAGSLLNPWVNHVTLTLSTTDLVDYMDASGYSHYVTKLATINSDDSVTDTRARRTLTLSGDVSGQATFNGPDSIELEVHVEDNSHGHTIENVAGLQEALDEKAEGEHEHEIDDILFLGQELDSKQPLDALLTALAALVTAPDKMAYFTGQDTVALTALTAFARSLLGCADAAAARETLAVTSHNLTGATSPSLPAGTDILEYFRVNPTAVFRTFGTGHGNAPSGFNYGPAFFQVHGINTGVATYGALTVIDVSDRQIWFNTLDNGTWTGWTQNYTTAHKPAPSEIGAAEAGYGFGGDNPTPLSDCNIPIETPTTVFMFANNTPNAPATSSGGSLLHLERSGRPTQIASDYMEGILFVRTYAATGWTGWARLYDTQNPPTAADVGAAPLNHTHTAAQANADIVAGGYGQVGSYGFLKLDDGQPDTIAGVTRAGSVLSWSAASGQVSGRPSGTWKCFGYAKISGGSGSDDCTQWVRVDAASIFEQPFELSEMVWDDAEHTSLTATVKFIDSGEHMQWTASKGDVEANGRWLFAMARDGEFGPVAEYVPPTPADIATRDNPPLRTSKMAQAVDSATHWDMMGDPTQAAAWRSYYRELYALEQAPGWPLVEQWPEAPQ